MGLSGWGPGSASYRFNHAPLVSLSINRVSSKTSFRLAETYDKVLHSL